MPGTSSFAGKVEGGKLVVEDKRAFKSAFYPHEGKRVRVTVERWRNTRSTPQNKYYWGVVVDLIGKQMGEDDPQSVHEMLKLEHNYEIHVLAKGKEVRVPKSTAELDTAAFLEYVEKIRRWASEFLELYIPDPNEAEI